MSEGNCCGGTCSSNDKKEEKHECNCGHNNEEHDCGCGHEEHNHEHHGCGCGHDHHTEHGHAHVKMQPEEELALLTTYSENLNTEKKLVDKRIEELKKEIKK